MPALLTHDFFGKDLYGTMYESIGETNDEYQAFLLGNQGPDPLFFSVLSPQYFPYQRIGSKMHDQKTNELLAALKQSLSTLKEFEYPIGLAYAKGFLCHYLLDRTMHPLVYYYQYALCSAGVEGLDSSNGHEVHSVIESELDEMVLYKKRHETIDTYNPAQQVLLASQNVLDIASKMYVYIALIVFKQTIPSKFFSLSTKNYRLVQWALYSPSGLKRDLLGATEELFRKYSFCRAMSLQDRKIEESQFDNHERIEWVDPFTGNAHSTSFWDLYDMTLDKAAIALRVFEHSDFDEEIAADITHGLNFSGKPVAPTITIDVE